MVSSNIAMWAIGIVINYFFLIQGVAFKDDPRKFVLMGWTLMIILALIGGTYVLNGVVGGAVS